MAKNPWRLEAPTKFDAAFQIWKYGADGDAVNAAALRRILQQRSFAQKCRRILMPKVTA